MTDQRIRDASTLERAELWGEELTPPSGRRVVVAALIAVAVAVIGVVLVARWVTAPFDSAADNRPAYATAPQMLATSVALTPVPLDRRELRIPASLKMSAQSARVEGLR